MRKTKLADLLVLGLLWLAAAAALAQDRACAIVLMHGKWGEPRNIAFFGRKLEPACEVETLDMPWSRRRAYDEPYPAAIGQIADAVQALRRRGFKRVLVAGHSFGANASLAYMAEVGDADGVIALAPGHSPRYMYDKGISRESVDQARALVAAGKGDDKLELADYNQGKHQHFRISADTLLSYFDPQGLGHMPTSAQRFKKAVPFLWVIGTRDPLYPLGPEWAWKLAPAHPLSRYLVVEADHANTPDVAADEVLAWISQLP